MSSPANIVTNILIAVLHSFSTNRQRRFAPFAGDNLMYGMYYIIAEARNCDFDLALVSSLADRALARFKVQRASRSFGASLASLSMRRLRKPCQESCGRLDLWS